MVKKANQSMLDSVRRWFNLSNDKLKDPRIIYEIPNNQENASLSRAKLSDCINSSLTVIIPTLNEEKNIADIIGEVHHLGFSNIVVVDGHSVDSTIEIARKLGVNVILQDGTGKGSALRQAFSCEGLSNWIIMLDADGSMDVREMSSFIEPFKNKIQVVKGSRFIPGGYSEDISLLRRVGNSFFLLLVNLLWKTNYTDLCYGYAAFTKEAVQKMYPVLRSRNFEIETEIFIKAKKLGLRTVEVPSVELRRRNGKSNLKAFKDGFRILKVIFYEATHR